MHILHEMASLVKAAGCIAALLLFPSALSGQGVVNAGNQFGGIVRPVFDPAGSPLVGTNYVAQIVYGSSSDTLTNLLGAPMPFRAVSPTSSRAGAWNVGTDNPRTLQGFREGDRVLMQVYVWDTFYFSGIGPVREILDRGGSEYGCTPSQLAGRSATYWYFVGNAGNPSTQGMVEFQSFQTKYVTEFYPPHAVEFGQGGRWLGSMVTNENATSVILNLLERPELGLAGLFNGSEPVGGAVESVAIGNPLDLTRVLSSNPFRSETLIEGPISGIALAAGQDFAESDLVSISGTVSNAVIRIKRPLLGRVELVMRHPPQSTPGFGECLVARKFVIDLHPAGDPNTLRISTAPERVRLRLDSGREHRLQRSTDLIAWETLETYQVGFPVCQNPGAGGTCWVHKDRDGISRSSEFEIPLQPWPSANGVRAVFFRINSQ